MTTDIYIYNRYLTNIPRGPGDVTAIPPESSLFDAALWATMCAEAGGEAALIAALGVTDIREAHYA